MARRPMVPIGYWFLPTDATLDARGQNCPLPVLRMEKRLEAMQAGERLIVLATDPMAKIDIPLYCRRHGHACTVNTDAGGFHFEIVRA